MFYLFQRQAVLLSIKYFFLIFIISGCASLNKNEKQSFLKNLNLIKYKPEPYEEIKNEAPILSKEEYGACVKNVPNLSYEFFSLFYSSNGLRVKAFVGLPPNFDPKKKYPLVIFNRGGHHNFGYLNVCFFELLNNFANTVNDSIIIAPQYRGSHGSEGSDEVGGKDLDDILNAIKWSRETNLIEPNKHYLIGWSRGAMMSYLLMKSQVNFKAAVVIAGPTDLFAEEKRRPEIAFLHKKLIPNYTSERTQALKERSAVYWPEKINTPLLILHGSEDSRISVKNSRQMQSLLKINNKTYKYVEYPNEEHDLGGVLPQIYNETRQWFNLYK